MAHGFQLDPHAVLGVTPGASLDDIRSAYYQKSKKYHPDAGGDEWVFRVLARSYEILKAAATAQAAATGATGDTNGHRIWDDLAETATDPVRIVDVEVIWIRFEGEKLVRPEDQDLEDQNLSGCLNITWPEPSQAERVLEMPDAAAILRSLIQVFETIQKVTPVVSAKSRIEDGRFVGWLGYTGGDRALEASTVLAQALKLNGLGVKEWTRDLVLPRDRG